MKENEALNRISNLLANYGKHLKDFPALSVPTSISSYNYTNSLVQQELNYDIVLLQRESAKLIKSLNHEQRHVYDTIMSSLSSTSSKCFYFVHGFGGTGKTFLWNA